MDIAKQFGTDEKKETEGVWEDLGEGAKVLIARSGNPNYEKEFNRLTKPYRQQIQRKTLSDEKSRELTIQLMARTILLNWEGIKEDGKEIKYSQKEAIRLLSTYKDFRELIAELAGSIELFRQETDEVLAKN